MPLTPFQASALRLIATNRSPDSHLAGASAILAAPASPRFSGDIDLFHDSEEAVARAYGMDAKILEANGYRVRTLLSQPGFILPRALDASEFPLCESAALKEELERFFGI